MLQIQIFLCFNNNLIIWYRYVWYYNGSSKSKLLNHPAFLETCALADPFLSVCSDRRGIPIFIDAWSRPGYHESDAQVTRIFRKDFLPPLLPSRRIGLWGQRPPIRWPLWGTPMIARPARILPTYDRIWESHANSGGGGRGKGEEDAHLHAPATWRTQCDVRGPPDAAYFAESSLDHETWDPSHPLLPPEHVCPRIN